MAFNPEAYHGNHEKFFNAFVEEYTKLHEIKPLQIKPDEKYWGKVYPDRIYFATYSMRKLLIAVILLWMEHLKNCGEDVEKYIKEDAPTPDALQFSEWVCRNVANGDGTLPFGNTYLAGYFHGVPVYFISVGLETPNDSQPVLEAGLKVLTARDFLIRNKMETHNAVVVAGDSVAEDENFKRKGKPSKDVNYPVKNSDEDEKEFKRRVRAYNTQYIQDNYPKGSRGAHVTGIAMASVERLSPLQEEILYQMILRLYFMVPQNLNIDKYAEGVFEDAGAGGVPQRLIYDQDVLEKTSEYVKFLHIGQALGFPLHGLMEFLRKSLL